MKKRARPATSASRTPVARHDNPFRIGGTVAGPFFTDREAEIARCAATLQEPGAKLLVTTDGEPAGTLGNATLNASALALRVHAAGRPPDAASGWKRFFRS